MKTLLTGMLLLFAAQSVHAQSHRYIKNYNDDIYNLIPCKDSTFYAVAIHPGCGINSYTVRYLDRKGDVIRTMEAPITVAGMTVFDGVTDDANNLTLLYYATGYNIVIKLDTAGNVAFTKSFNPIGYQFNKIIALNNGYYLCGNKVYTGPNDPLSMAIAKVDTDGLFEWAKIYQKPGYQNLLMQDCLLRNDSLFVGGYYNSGESPLPSYPYLASIGPDGTPGQEYTYVVDSTSWMFEPYKITDLDFYDGDQIYVKLRASAGVDALMKLNGNLEHVWTKEIVGDLEMICASYDGGVFFNTTTCFNSGLMRMNAAGTITDYYENTLSSSLGTATATTMQRHDCGYLINTQIGWPEDTYSHIPSDGGYWDGTNILPGGNQTYPITSVIRREEPTTVTSATFTQFNLITTFANPPQTITTYGIETTNCNGELALGEKELPQLAVYPNPLHGEVLYIDGAGKGPATVYDAFGNRVYSGTIVDGALSLGSLAPGLYFLETGNAVARFVKD